MTPFFQILFQNGRSASNQQLSHFSETNMITFFENAAIFRPFSKHFPKCRFQPRWDALFIGCCCASPLTVYGFETSSFLWTIILNLKLVAPPLLPFTVLKPLNSIPLRMKLVNISCASPLTVYGFETREEQIQILQRQIWSCASPLTVYGFETFREEVNSTLVQPGCASPLTVYGFETLTPIGCLYLFIWGCASPLTVYGFETIRY